MLNETESLITEAKKYLNSEISYTPRAHVYATLALVHAVKELNETLKAKTVVQKTDKQQE